MRRRRKIRILLILLIALLLGAGSFLYMNKSLRPVLVGLSAARVESVAARAMNDAILEILSARDTGDGLLKVYTASEGGVYLLTANAGKLNTIAADCADSAQKKIMALGEQGVSVPVGTLRVFRCWREWGLPLPCALHRRERCARLFPVSFAQRASTRRCIVSHWR